jgi:hypothetical protein
VASHRPSAFFFNLYDKHTLFSFRHRFQLSEQQETVPASTRLANLPHGLHYLSLLLTLDPTPSTSTSSNKHL